MKSFSYKGAVLAASMAATAIFTPSVSAQSSDIDFFTESNIRSALADQNISIETKVIEGTTYLISEKDGIKFVMILQACNDQREKCQGLHFYASWGAPEGVPEATLRKRMDSYENKYAFAKAGFTSSGGVYVSRYAISDFGMKPKTLRSNFTNYYALVRMFRDQVVDGK